MKSRVKRYLTLFHVLGEGNPLEKIDKAVNFILIPQLYI